MRYWIISLAVILALAAPSFAWQDTDCPEGHIETDTVSDGKVFPSTTTSITELLGTAHKGGDDQADADTRGIVYTLYLWWDRDKDGTADSGDEPVGFAVLTAGIDDAVTTIPINASVFFLSSGFVTIGTELIQYTGKTGNTLTGATRGANEATAASHSAGDAVTAVNAWENAASYTCDGSPDNTIGWDATTPTADDGTEGNLLQGGDTITVVAGRYYLMKLRVVDGSGNTNTEVDDADVFESYGPSAYLDEDGDATQGLEDDEVWQLRINKKPRRR